MVKAAVDTGVSGYTSIVNDYTVSLYHYITGY